MVETGLAARSLLAEKLAEDGRRRQQAFASAFSSANALLAQQVAASLKAREAAPSEEVLVALLARDQ